jgi:DNA-binding FadR family transcriptional regulator
MLPSLAPEPLRAVLRRRGRIRNPVRSAHGLVMRAIGLGIVRGEFPVGVVLPGNETLTARFGVSRTALREALQTLAAKGLIASKTRIGTRVLEERHWNMFDADILAWRLEAGLDERFLARLFEIRQAVEPPAAALAALRRSDADLARMAAALAEMRRDGGHDRDSFTDCDLEFHHAVLDASGNPFMRSIGTVIETALAASFTLSSPVDSPAALALSADQHEAIFRAIERRDPGAAVEAMTTVIAQGAKSGGLGSLVRTVADVPVTSIENRR